MERDGEDQGVIEATLDVDLWLVQSRDGTYSLIAPIARDKVTGEHMPGVLVHPKVIRILRAEKDKIKVALA